MAGSPLLENNKDGDDNQQKTDQIIPSEIFLQIKYGKNGKHNKRDNLLNGFELCDRELVRANSVCGNLKTILDKSDKPAYHDSGPERAVFVFEMPIPGNSHKYVRYRQKNYSFHKKPASKK